MPNPDTLNNGIHGFDAVDIEVRGYEMLGS
jgi:hypothetical protein